MINYLGIKDFKKNQKLTSYGFNNSLDWLQPKEATTGDKNKMANINDTAKETIEVKFTTIDQLDKIDSAIEVFSDGEGQKKDGEKFTYSYIMVAEGEVRVPKTVLLEIKAQNEERTKSNKPLIKSFKVTKKGEGINTSYSVVILE
jgi:hypothetical protein